MTSFWNCDIVNLCLFKEIFGFWVCPKISLGGKHKFLFWYCCRWFVVDVLVGFLKALSLFCKMQKIWPYSSWWGKNGPVHILYSYDVITLVTSYVSNDVTIFRRLSNGVRSRARCTGVCRHPSRNNFYALSQVIFYLFTLFNTASSAALQIYHRGCWD